MLRNDAGWKGLLEYIFPHFIPFFLPEHAHLFDIEKPFEFLDKELQQLYPPEAKQELKFVDKLVKAFTKSGEEKWILIHIEVQGYKDTDFGKRMFTYFYRILDRYNVPVTAIAIFTDSGKSFMPNQYVYDFAGTQNTYLFNTYKVLQQDEKLLEQSENPFATAILTVLLALKKKKLVDENLLHLKLDLVKRMLTRGFTSKTVERMLVFIKEYVNFAKPETAIKFDQAIDLLTNNIQPMGIIEQVLELREQKGRRERNTIFVENLIRNTDFLDERIAELADVPIEFVKKMRVKLKKWCPKDLCYNDLLTNNIQPMGIIEQVLELRE